MQFLPQEPVHNYMEKQIGDVPVHQLQEETVDTAMVIPQECVSLRLDEQIVDDPVPFLQQPGSFRKTLCQRAFFLKNSLMSQSWTFRTRSC